MNNYAFGVLIGSILVGCITGAIPAISGVIKRKLLLGVIGFLACVISSLFLGLLLAVPVCAVFTYLIFQKGHSAETNSSIVSSESDAVEKLEEYQKLLDNGVITQEEFDAKKKQLLGL